jgi:1,4-dihydroxy-2-naphthoate octaprenyltransferase
MIKKATLIHLRLPFSFFLMPFFLFGISQLHNFDVFKLVMAFIGIHVFHNGASNAFNSYFDKDEGSIGGIENPPPVDKQLYVVSLVFDLIAVVMACFVSYAFAIMVFMIGLASKAYSHPLIRFKKYAVLGLLIVAFFQGAWTYLMAIVVDVNYEISTQHIYAASICSLMLLGSYPMTQIYQHAEDAKRGDKTFSLLLGVRNTFVWTMSVFSIATALFVWYFSVYENVAIAILYLLVMSPVVLFFLQWMYASWNDESKANYKSTMKLNLMSSLCFNVFFIGLIVFKITT